MSVPHAFELPFVEVTKERILDGTIPADSAILFPGSSDGPVFPMGFTDDDEGELYMNVVDTDGHDTVIPVEFLPGISVKNFNPPGGLEPVRLIILQYFKPEAGLEANQERIVEPIKFYWGNGPGHQGLIVDGEVKQDPEKPTFSLFAIQRATYRLTRFHHRNLRYNNVGSRIFPLPRINGLLGHPAEDPLFRDEYGLY